MEALVSTDWLAKHLGEADLAVVDSSWFMPSSGRMARDEFLTHHIPGARFLDVDEVSDHDDPAPHMLPDAAAFGAAMEDIGVGRDDRIVVYDNSPTRTAARGWFTFRHFGVDKVAVLDGGLGKWIAEGRPTESGEPAPRAARFDAIERGDVVAKAEVLDEYPVLDARGAGRFEGTEPEPRPGLAGGHIPGSRNLPFGALYDAEGCFKSRAELAAAFAKAGIDPARPFIASCGSGVTATSLLFAAHLLGGGEAKLYDGSWAEWGADPATPKAIGPA